MILMLNLIKMMLKIFDNQLIKLYNRKIISNQKLFSYNFQYLK